MTVPAAAAAAGLVELRREALRHQAHQRRTDRLRSDSARAQQRSVGIGTGVDRHPPRVGGQEFALTHCATTLRIYGFSYSFEDGDGRRAMRALSASIWPPRTLENDGVVLAVTTMDSGVVAGADGVRG